MLVDFGIAFKEIPLAIGLAEQFWRRHQTEGRQIDRFCAAVHALFVSQNPQYLQFEEFTYLYTALDTCFKILWKKEPRTGNNPPHTERLQWTCGQLHIPVPAWANVGTGRSTQVARLRNDAIHEGLFVDQPLGFAMEGSESNQNLPLEMKRLACRFLAGILDVSDSDYFQSPLNDGQKDLLRLT